MPTLPTNRKVQKWIYAALGELGLKDSDGGAWLNVDRAITHLIEEVGLPTITGGKIHIQVMADAVRVFRKTAFTTVAIRLLQDTPTYNSMTSMHIL